MAVQKDRMFRIPIEGTEELLLQPPSLSISRSSLENKMYRHVTSI